MLGDGLAGDAGAAGELRDGAGFAAGELEDQREAGSVAQGGEDGGLRAEAGGDYLNG